MKRFMQLSVGLLCLTVAGSIGAQFHQDSAHAQGACTYNAVYFDNSTAHIYALRSDGVLLRYGLNDGSVVPYTNPAPVGKYVALFRREQDPYGDLFLLRDDGALFFLDWAGGLNETWVPLATLPACLPVPTSSSTVGGVKAKYR